MNATVASTVLAFDYGTKKIGVASGQAITATGTPQPALHSKQQKPDFDGIEAQIRQWQPDALLVGLPLNMDGSESELSQRARRFARQLNGRFGKPVWMVDERLSTREARERLGDKYKGGADARVDSLAAVLIIEGYFESGGEQP